VRPENLKIRAGEWDTQKTIEPQPHQVTSMTSDRCYDFLNILDFCFVNGLNDT
jgi:hypothetical protein